MFYVKLQVIFATLDGSIANVMTTRDEQNTYFQIQLASGLPRDG